MLGPVFFCAGRKNIKTNLRQIKNLKMCTRLVLLNVRKRGVEKMHKTLQFACTYLIGLLHLDTTQNNA